MWLLAPFPSVECFWPGLFLGKDYGMAVGPLGQSPGTKFLLVFCSDFSEIPSFRVHRIFDLASTTPSPLFRNAKTP